MNKDKGVQECPDTYRDRLTSTMFHSSSTVGPIKKAYLFCIALLMLVVANAKIDYPTNITVAQDGTGNYKTIQEAIDAVRAYSPEHITINIKNGTYREKITMPSWVTNISLIGEDRDKTIISYSDYSGKLMAVENDTVLNKKKFSTFNSYTMRIMGNDVSIEKLTIANAAGRVGQAVALHVDGDRISIKDCNLLGNQDTLLTAGDTSHQYYENCLIEGTTDFIFGAATVLFENCTIKSLTNSYITAASTTQRQQFGYVFMNCKLVANEEATKVYLGRPWRANAKTVFINCELGKHIREEGWNNWGKVENEATAYYAEYNNKGEGAETAKRVTWSKQLTKKEAKQYTRKNILEDWKP